MPGQTQVSMCRERATDQDVGIENDALTLHRRSVFRRVVRRSVRSRSLAPQLVSKNEEGLNVARPKSLVLSHRKDDGDISILTPDHDRFVLSVIENCAQAIFGLRGGNILHSFAQTS